MGIIDRYRKKGGFAQLVQVIETTPRDKQEKFLKMMAEESPEWEKEVRAKVLTFEKVLTWETQYITQIINKLPVIQLAMIYGKSDNSTRELLEKCFNYRQKRSIDDAVSSKSPTAAEYETALYKMFNEIRLQISTGDLKLDKVDSTLIILNNMEDYLNTTDSNKKTLAESTKSAPPLYVVQPEEAIPETPLLSPEDLTKLKNKISSLNQENLRLTQENEILKSKLDQIKKIA